MQKGNVTIAMLTGWGLTLAITTVGGIMAAINHNDAKIDVVRSDLSSQSANIATLSAESAQYRRDIDNINGKLDQLLWAQGIKPITSVTSAVIKSQ